MAPFWNNFSATVPPTFSELVLELGEASSEFTQPPPILQGNWTEVDRLFEGLLDRCPDFKLVIRTDRLDARDEFQAQTKERFPLMARRNRVQFETSSTVDEYWR